MAMGRQPLEPLLAEIVAELGRSETDHNFLPTWNILDGIAEKATDLCYDAESNRQDDLVDRRAGAINMAVLALRLLRDGCGGNGA